MAAFEASYGDVLEVPRKHPLIEKLKALFKPAEPEVETALKLREKIMALYGDQDVADAICAGLQVMEPAYMDQSTRDVVYVAELVVEAPKPKKKKKSVTWFIDIPYTEKKGEVIEGPVSSCLNFDKDLPVM